MPKHLQAHLKTAPANALSKFLKELAKPTQREFQKFSSTL